ncbi:unnamed protein product [Penicillium salamii]|uniref:Aminoglycoside phosphotransferase domain-containing protein n=1 Tax=Penicillium salamii TaxID=1612424 RepID=A0A9W4NUJ1_9EURO|nr:unnamed protein product [Penicillium salamii]CAG8403985.1 unnamed protein product [Penicillium salamii]CAG8408964.1 unnamed protein product [Penicillium salamii]CAG8411401.1 unnamed protein product [Penicillium salamii]
MGRLESIRIGLFPCLFPIGLFTSESLSLLSKVPPLPMNLADPRDGLEWAQTVVIESPRWTKEPALEAVQALAQSNLTKERDVKVTFHSEGAFNKLYIVESDYGPNLIVRVSSPVDPQYKTLSEVATLEFVHLETSIPVPRVIAFDARPRDGFQSEWILMERMPGQALQEAWRTLSWDAKITSVKTVAEYLVDLNKTRFSAIGNLYQPCQLPASSEDARSEPSSNPSGDKPCVVDRISSFPFFWSYHFEMEVPRGPFTCSRDWLASQLLLHANDAERMLAAAEDEEQVEEAKTLQVIVQRLQQHLDPFFPPQEDSLEEYTLHHDDISSQNLLVNQEGHLTALVDWECVSVVPVYKTAEWLIFLAGPDSEFEDYPDPNNYAKVDGSLDENDIYQEHVLEYELTKLRPIFLEHMSKLSPNWVKINEDERLRRKADFEYAVQGCASYMMWPDIQEWLDSMENGDYYNLKVLPYD